MEGYLTINEVAEKWNLTPRRVQKMCSEGLIDGVTKFGKSWAIPADLERPEDRRVKSGKYRDWRKKHAEKI
jgi:hypothetical protein